MFIGRWYSQLKNRVPQGVWLFASFSFIPIFKFHLQSDGSFLSKSALGEKVIPADGGVYSWYL
ncbi:hypothetical protein SAMN04489724_0441 [Algoriphagus locisalis]|uniref:Uncharacterized protein n=1 Tax=Algoriphagus locisalis TaxID=305507 RepID=A0A1I6XG75_9BACT|nr:hypothetical protein SAMN04489724_0441 [Algoriphagus locisalis]